MYVIIYICSQKIPFCYNVFQPADLLFTESPPFLPDIIRETQFTILYSLFITYAAKTIVLALIFSNPKTCIKLHISRIMRKPTFCICENKDADQLRGNREADQCLCFRYIDSTIPLLSKSKISSL